MFKSVTLLAIAALAWSSPLQNADLDYDWIACVNDSQCRPFECCAIIEQGSYTIRDCANMLYIHTESSFYSLSYQPYMFIYMIVYNFEYMGPNIDEYTFGSYNGPYDWTIIPMTSAVCDSASKISAAAVVGASLAMNLMQ